MTYYYTPAMKAETIEEMKAFSTYDADYFYSKPNLIECFDLSDVEKQFKGFDPQAGYYKYEGEVVDFMKRYFSIIVLCFVSPLIKDKTVSYFDSQEKYDRDIRTVSKIGKFVRKIGPYYNDKQVETIVNILVDQYCESDYIYHVGSAQEDFKKVYEGKPSKGRNIGNYSCLIASCMRDKFKHLDYHPCEVYGSGDFEIHYLTDNDGNIAARTILCVKDKFYANVYTTSKLAGDALVSLLKEKVEGAKHHRDAGNFNFPWDGAKLLKLESSDGFAAPYIDVQQDVDDKGDHFAITYNDGDFVFCSTSGLRRQMCNCANCEDEINPEDAVSFDGNYYCEGCLNWCDYAQEYTTDDIVFVYEGGRWGNFERWSETAAQEHAVWDEETNRWYTEDYYAELVAERESDDSEEEEETEVDCEIKVGSMVRVISNQTNFHCAITMDEGIVGSINTTGTYRVTLRHQTNGAKYIQNIPLCDLELV